MAGNRIVLSWELKEIAAVIQGARILVDLVRDGQAPDEETAALVPAASSAVCTLAALRLKAVALACHGAIDPRHLISPHSSAVDVDAEVGVSLTPWDSTSPSSPRRRKRGTA